MDFYLREAIKAFVLGKLSSHKALLATQRANLLSSYKSSISLAQAIAYGVRRGFFLPILRNAQLTALCTMGRGSLA